MRPARPEPRNVSMWRGQVKDMIFSGSGKRGRSFFSALNRSSTERRLGHDGDQRAVLLGRAGVDQEPLVDDGEAHDEDVGAIDDADDFVHVEAVVVHGGIV